MNPRLKSSCILIIPTVGFKASGKSQTFQRYSLRLITLLVHSLCQHPIIFSLFFVSFSRNNFQTCSFGNFSTSMFSSISNSSPKFTGWVIPGQGLFLLSKFAWPISFKLPGLLSLYLFPDFCIFFIEKIRVAVQSMCHLSDQTATV